MSMTPPVSSSPATQVVRSSTLEEVNATVENCIYFQPSVKTLSEAYGLLHSTNPMSAVIFLDQEKSQHCFISKDADGNILGSPKYFQFDKGDGVWTNGGGKWVADADFSKFFYKDLTEGKIYLPVPSDNTQQAKKIETILQNKEPFSFCILANQNSDHKLYFINENNQLIDKDFRYTEEGWQNGGGWFFSLDKLFADMMTCSVEQLKPVIL